MGIGNVHSIKMNIALMVCHKLPYILGYVL